MSQLDLSLIIPAYNEQAKIEKDIREAFSYFNKANIKGEVIVSTDGVTDQTNNIVKKLTSEFKNLKLLAVKQKIGKGAAIKKAVRVARGRYIMFADAGLCVPFKYIKIGLNILSKGYDLVLASRAEKASVIKLSQPFYRQIGAKLFGLIIRNFMGIPKDIKDTQCGFKLYKAKVAKDLYGKLQTKTMMFDIEVILRAKKLGFKIGQFAVEWKNDADTKFKPISGSLVNFKELLYIKFKYQL